MLLLGQGAPSGLIFITGGVRSGKSSFAETMAACLGGRVAYIATCAPSDGEMQTRVRAHQERRPASWLTIEETVDVARAVELAADRADVILVDCLTLLVSNLLLAAEPSEDREAEILRRIQCLVEAARTASAQVIVVSNEVGAGIVPQNHLARMYRDLLGRANQVVASAADEVYLCVAGIPVAIGRGPSLPLPEARPSRPAPVQGRACPDAGSRPPVGPVGLLLIAFQFLTSIPVKLRRCYEPRESARAMAFFPLVGGGLGALLVALDIAFGLFLPGMARAALVVLASAVLTGGLHLDGLADTADGLLGGHSRERALTIMRDSRVGTFGLLAVLAFYLTRFAVLVEAAPMVRWGSLILAPTLGRWIMTWAARAFPCARQDGLGRGYRELVGWREVGAGAGTVLVVAAGTVALLRLPLLGTVLLAALALLASLLAARLMANRIGGMTGDTLGALNELAELAIFVLAPVCLV